MSSVPAADSDQLGLDRLTERRNAEAASSTGIAPKILEYLDDLDVTVMEYIEGVVPTAEDLQTPAQVRKLAEACRRLHTGRRFSSNFDMHAMVERWWSVCLRREVHVPDGVRDRMDLVDEIAAALAIDPLPRAPCHNDLAPYNLIDDGRQLWIIDFEFSGNNDPCNDLGSIASEAELNQEQWALLCESYFGEATPRLLARMSLYNLVAMVGWMLFCAIRDYEDGVSGYWDAAAEGLDSDELPNLMRKAR